jgi:hypothetical protein
MVKCQICNKEVKEIKERTIDGESVLECGECYLKRFKKEKQSKIKDFIKKNIREVSREWNYRELDVDSNLNISASIIVRCSDSGSQRYFLCKECNKKINSEEEIFEHLLVSHFSF